MAVPNSRVTSLRAEASPCLSRGRELVMVSVEGSWPELGPGRLRPSSVAAATMHALRSVQ